jgi:hypothetical protein
MLSTGVNKRAKTKKRLLGFSLIPRKYISIKIYIKREE